MNDPTNRRAKRLVFRVFLPLLLVVAFIAIVAVVWMNSPPKKQGPSGPFKMAGVKVVDPAAPESRPKLEILSPDSSRTDKKSSLVHVTFDVRLEIPPGGTFPTMFLVDIKKGRASYGSYFPQPVEQGDGVYLAHCKFDGNLKPGTYTLEATCIDHIKPGSSSSKVTAQTTAKAVAEVRVR